LDAVRDLPYLYLTTTGRKTGLPREIEIWFIVYGGSFYIFAEGFHRADWVRNIARNTKVRVRAADRGTRCRIWRARNTAGEMDSRFGLRPYRSTGDQPATQSRPAL
jgi:deazaflavin-dependent oxidoreductase (nitroreductase family)